MRVVGALVLGIVLGGCGESTASGVDIPVVSGTYEGMVAGAGLTSFPQEGATDFQMTVDRTAGRVEVRYTVGGADVIEYWSIAAPATLAFDTFGGRQVP